MDNYSNISNLKKGAATTEEKSRVVINGLNNPEEVFSPSVVVTKKAEIKSQRDMARKRIMNIVEDKS